MATAALELLISMRDEASSGLSAVGGALGTLGTVAAGAAIGGFVALGAAIKGGMEDARASAGLMASTQQTITTMGNAAGRSAQEVADLAASLSDAAGKSLFGDDQIQQASNLLLTFGNIKGETFDLATALTVDLAQALGGEPKAQAMMLGKALNDPTKGLTALGKAGLTFTEEQKGVIAALQAGGDMAGAQAIIIAELNKQVGGQGAAAAAAAGGWVQFQARMGEAAETVGALLLPVMDAFGAVMVAHVAPAVEAVAGAFAGVVGAFQEAGPMSSEFGEAIGYLATQLGLPGEAVQNLVFWIQGNLVPAFQNFMASLQPIRDFISANLTPILVGLGVALAVSVMPAIVAFIPVLITAGIAAAAATGSFLLMIAPFVAIGVAVALLYQAWVTNFGGIQEIIQPVIDAVVNGFGSGGILGAISGLVSGLSAAFPQIIAWFGTAATAIGQQLLAWGQALVNWIAPAIPPAIAALSALASSFFSWVASQAAPLIASFSSWATGIAAWIPGAIVSFLAAWPGMLSGFLNWIAGAVGPIIAGFGSWLAAFLGETAKWAIAFISWVGPMIPGLLAALAGAAAALIVFLGQTLGVIVGKLLEWGIAFVKWVAPMIPPMLAALGGAIVALLGWAAQQVPVIAAKLLEWGQAFLGWVGTEVVPKLPGILATILTTIGGWVSSAAAWLADQAMSLGRSIVDGVSKGISAAAGSVINSMKSMANDALNAAKSALGISSPSTVMAQLVGIPMIEGIAKGMEFATPKLLTSVLEVGSKIVDLIDKGVGAFQKLRNMAAVPLSSIANFTDTLFTAMRLFGEAVATFTRGAIASASLFAFKANQFIETMSAAIDMIVKLQDFKGVAPQAIRDFADAFDLAIKELVRIAQFQTMLAMLHAKQFADNAGEIVKVIGVGVDALTKLRNFARPSVEAIWSFSAALADTVFAFQSLGGKFSGDMLSAASAFAEGVGKVVAVIGSGVEGLAALKDFARPGIDAIWAFAASLADITFAFLVMGSKFSVEMLAAASAFAKSVGDVVGAIAAGVEGLTLLADFARPGIDAIWAFAASLADITYAFLVMGAKFSTDMLDAAAAFAESAGQIVAVIGAGVEGFAALADFVAPTWATVQAFGLALGDVVMMISIIAQQFSTEGLEAATAFANTAGTVVGVLKSGVEGMMALSTFQAPSQQAVTDFANAIHYVVVNMTWIAANFAAEGLGAAAAFADTAGKVIGTLKSGVEGMMALATFAAPSQQAVADFANAVHFIVVNMMWVAGNFTAEALQAAVTFAEGSKVVLDTIKAAMNAFTELTKFQGGGTGARYRLLKQSRAAPYRVPGGGPAGGDGPGAADYRGAYERVCRRRAEPRCDRAERRHRGTERSRRARLVRLHDRREHDRRDDQRGHRGDAGVGQRRGCRDVRRACGCPGGAGYRQSVQGI